MRDLALELISAALVHSHGGEPVTDPAELPDELDGLCDLLDTLVAVGRVLAVVRGEVEAKTATVLGPGRPYRYGDYLVRWGHGYKWRPIDAAAENMIRTLVAADDADGILDLFNLNYMRKTGVEKVAKRLGQDPEVAVHTVLYKDWDAEPRVSFKYEPEAG